MAILAQSDIRNNSGDVIYRNVGGIIRMQILEHSPNTSISGSANGTLFSVSFTKLLSASESNIIVESHIWGHGANSGVSGPYLEISGSGNRDYNHTYQYEGGQGNTPIHGMSWWTTLGAGSHTITAGWSPNNGSSGESPFTTLNTNQGQSDSRYRKHVSRLLVMEVVK